MNNVANGISRFFKRDFKKRFLTLMSFPLFFCCLFFLDYTLLPEYKTTDRIVSVYTISSYSTNQSNGTRTRSGSYQYVTENDFVFFTEGIKRIQTPEIEIAITPLFDTVKSVIVDTREVEFNLGLYGIERILLLAVFISILISFAYIFLKKTISENARLNLIYFNIFIFIIWFWLFLLFAL